MEFEAPEGCIYLPNWMMRMLEFKEEDFAFMKLVELKKGTLVKFQPHFTKFTELSNPGALLEKSMRNYACLTTGDTIYIHHGDMIYPIEITEVQPDEKEHAISVVDTDLEVDFDEPKDYAAYMEQRKEKEMEGFAFPAPSSPGSEQPRDP
jgi:ubiquitin fusion degradation protein 1